MNLFYIILTQQISLDICQNNEAPESLHIGPTALKIILSHSLCSYNILLLLYKISYPYFKMNLKNLLHLTQQANNIQNAGHIFK
jgi:hypothetical protein